MSKKEILLVFIHGFMGSHESFKTFPDDLKNHLEMRYKNELGNHAEIETLIYPAYETFGNNQRQVQLLMDWLILHGSSAKYKNVFLIAHSMGGLLAADAYRYLYKLKPKTIKDDSSSGSYISKFKSSLSSYFSYQQSSSDHSENDMRFLINISGIIAFDSPFFGLHPNVVLKTGYEKTKAALPTKLPKNIPSSIAPLAKTAVNQLIPEKVTLPLGAQIETDWLKSSLHSKISSDDVSNSSLNPFVGSANINLEELTTGSSIVGSVLVGTSVATSATHLAVAKGLGVIATAGDRLVSWTQFLNLLIHSKSECLERITILHQEHTHSKSLYFKAYFNVLPHHETPSKYADSAEKNELQEYLFRNPPVHPSSRTFCIPPHHDDQLNHVEHHFKSLPSPLEDEIDAHMFLFDRQVVGGEHYGWFLDHVSRDLLDGLVHLSFPAK